MAQRIALIPHSVFNDSKNGSDENERANGVEAVQTLLPGYAPLEYLRSRVVTGFMEYIGSDNEKAKVTTFRARPVITTLLRCWSDCYQPSFLMRLLGAKYITNYQCLGEPFYANNGVLLPMDAVDYASEYHVDRRSEKGWTKKNEHGLYAVRNQLARVIVRIDWDGKSNDFDYSMEHQPSNRTVIDEMKLPTYATNGKG